ncbi:MAG: hypothetical protein HGA85_02630 [Nanoarchaeota archaeon]|nr:hypothetical protein [Nanoarchaeota archaeon]
MDSAVSEGLISEQERPKLENLMALAGFLDRIKVSYVVIGGAGCTPYMPEREKRASTPWPISDLDIAVSDITPEMSGNLNRGKVVSYVNIDPILGISFSYEQIDGHYHFTPPNIERCCLFYSKVHKVTIRKEDISRPFNIEIDRRRIRFARPEFIILTYMNPGLNEKRTVRLSDMLNNMGEDQIGVIGDYVSRRIMEGDLSKEHIIESEPLFARYGSKAAKIFYSDVVSAITKAR